MHSEEAAFWMNNVPGYSNRSYVTEMGKHRCPVGVRTQDDGVLNFRFIMCVFSLSFTWEIVLEITIKTESAWDAENDLYLDVQEGVGGVLGIWSHALLQMNSSCCVVLRDLPLHTLSRHKLPLVGLAGWTFQNVPRTPLESVSYETSGSANTF